MKNLVKPLQWVAAKPSTNPSQYANIGFKGLQYGIYLVADYWMAFWTVDSYPDIYEAVFNAYDKQYKTEDEAKTACQEHYADMILSGLSPEAVAALESISSPAQTPKT